MNGHRKSRLKNANTNMSSKIKAAIWSALVIIALVALITLIKRKTSQKDDIAFDVERREVSVPTADGQMLSADLLLPQLKNRQSASKKFPGVILLGPFWESRQLYIPLANTLCEEGFIVLSIDVRHPSEAGNGKSFDPQSIGKLPIDTEAAIAYLQTNPEVDSSRLAIMGTSITARSALLGAGFRKSVRGTILVSAVLDSVALEMIREAPFRPILVVVSFQDGPAGSQARAIYEASTHPDSHLEVYYEAGEGSGIWRTPHIVEMIPLITDWLTKVLR
jgi:dienelactone hydrolase